MSDHPQHEPIPQPPEHLIVGNLFDIKAATPVQSLMALARQYGPIFQLHVAGQRVIVVSGFSLMDELCNEKRFDKSVSGTIHRPGRSEATACSPLRRMNRTGAKPTTSCFLTSARRPC
jgi:cytochrome P450